MFQIVLILVSFILTCQAQKEHLTCLRTINALEDQTLSNSPTNPTMIQGHVGKKGPQGVKGEKGEPAISNNEDINAITERLYILEKKVENLTEIVERRNKSMEIQADSCVGGVIYDNQCIKLAWIQGRERVNFVEAVRRCALNGSRLAEIQSNEMQGIVDTYVRNTWNYAVSGNTYVYVWLGLIYQPTENPGKRVTLSNGSRVLLERWHSGYPSSTASHTNILLSVYQDEKNSSNGIVNFRPTYEELVPLCAYNI